MRPLAMQTVLAASLGAAALAAGGCFTIPGLGELLAFYSAVTPSTISNDTGGPVDVWFHLGLCGRADDVPETLALDGPWRLEPGETLIVPWMTYADSVKAVRTIESAEPGSGLAFAWGVAACGSGKAEAVRWFETSSPTNAILAFGEAAAVRKSDDKAVVVVARVGADEPKGRPGRELPESFDPHPGTAPTFAAMRGWPDAPIGQAWAPPTGPIIVGGQQPRPTTSTSPPTPPSPSPAASSSP